MSAALRASFGLDISWPCGVKCCSSCRFFTIRSLTRRPHGMGISRTCSARQKIPVYSKYAFHLALRGKEYQPLGQILQKVDQDETARERVSVQDSQDAITVFCRRRTLVSEWYCLRLLPWWLRITLDFWKICSWLDAIQMRPSLRLED